MALNLLTMIPPDPLLMGLDLAVGKQLGTTAFGNILRGDLTGAVKGAVYPEQSLPIQTLTAYEQYKAGKGEPVEDGWTDRIKKFLFNVSTDPILIGAAVLSAYFSPLHALRNKIPIALKRLDKDIGGVAKWILPMENIIERKDPFNVITKLGGLGQLRFMKFQNEFISKYSKITEPLRQGGEAVRKENMAKIALALDDRSGTMINELPKSLQVPATQIKTLFNDMADMIGLEKQAQISHYLPHIFPGVGMNDWIDIDPAKLYKAIQNTRTFDQYLSKLKPIESPFKDPAGSKEITSMLNEMGSGSFLNNKVAKEIYNQFLLPREGVVTKEIGGYGVDYTLDLDAIMPVYIRRAGRTYGFARQLKNDRLFPDMEDFAHYVVTEGNPAHPGIVENLKNVPIIEQLTQLHKAAFIADPITGRPAMPNVQQVMGNWLDSLLGKMNPGDMWAATAWNNMRLPLLDKLTKMQESNALKNHEWVRDGIEWLKQPFEKMTAGRIQNLAVNYTMSSALGLSVPSTLLNLLQTPLTTRSAIGTKGMVNGMLEIVNRFKQAWQIHKQVGGDIRDIFPQVFGDFLENSYLDPKTFNLAWLGKDELDVVMAHELANKYVQRAASWVMQPFTLAEKFNHAVAFYGSKSLYKDPKIFQELFPNMTGLNDQMKEKLINYMSSKIVTQSQFVPSPGMQTMWVRANLPTVGRQFLNFPLRFKGWMWDSLYRGAAELDGLPPTAGIMEKFKKGGYGNYGTWLRAVAGGSLINRFFQDVAGVDLSRGLGADVMPNAPDDSPFAPLPIAPVPNMLFTTAQAVASGEMDGMKRIMPLMVPGGIALSKLMRLHQQTTPEGYYDEQGRLVYSSGQADQLFNAVVGPSVLKKRETLGIKQTQVLREKVREYRRNYAMAMAQSNVPKMTQLSNQWKEEFPELPPLQVDPADVDRARASALETRLQRVIKSSGQEVQSLLGAVAMQDAADQYWGLTGTNINSLAYSED